MKFEGTSRETEIRLAKSPDIAKAMGLRHKHVRRADWNTVKDGYMYVAVLIKFLQHADIRKTLLETGDALLVEHTDNDSYWGDGGDGSGKNMMGQILMKVRSELVTS